MAEPEPRVLVTGATGSVGRELVQQLLRDGARVRGGSRHPATANLPAGVEPVRLDIGEPSTLERAVTGVDAVFLLWPFFESGDEAHDRAEEVAAIVGRHARHVVYLSSQGAATQPDSMFAVVEEALEAAVGSWTMLRPTGFATNALLWADQVCDGEVVRWPYGRLARPLIHERDIAAVAAAALLGRDHDGRRLVITGPERIAQDRQVMIIGDTIGRALRWEELDRTRAAAELDVPPAMLDAWEAFLTDPEPVTDEVSWITGRPALDFASWARDHVEDYRKTLPTTKEGRG